MYALKIRELALAVAGEHDPANIKILQDVYDTLVNKLDKYFKCNRVPHTMESDEAEIRHTTLLVQARRYVSVKLFRKMVNPIISVECIVNTNTVCAGSRRRRCQHVPPSNRRDSELRGYDV
jgi:hypothetical protein